MRARRWAKAVVAATVLGALCALPAVALASNSSRGDDSSCTGPEQSSHSVRKTKSNEPKPSVSCPSIEVEKKAGQDSYQQGDSIKWTVTITNTGDSDVKVTAKDKGVKLYGPGGSSETARKAAKARSKSSSPGSCDDVQQSSSKRTSKSLRKSKSEGCDKKEKCGGVIAPEESLVCTGYQEAEKCGTVKNTVKVTAVGVKKAGDHSDNHYSNSSKTSKSTKHTKHKKHGVVVKASGETFVFCDLKVSKDAKVSYVKTWDWIIDKSADQTKVESTGDTAVVNYTVKVTKSDAPAVSNVKVNGTIKVYNPYPFAVDVKVTDKLTSDDPCTVEGVDEKSATIGHGTATFAYECVLTAVPGPEVKNVATTKFTVNGTPGTATGEAGIETGYVTEVDGTVNVTDLVWKLGTPDVLFVPEAPLGTTSETKEFTYSRTYDVPATNCDSYKNIATVSGVGVPAYPPHEEHEGTTTEGTTTGGTTTGGYHESSYGSTTNYGTTTENTASTETTGSTESTESTTTDGSPPPPTSTLPKSDHWTVEICRKVQDLAVTKTATTKTSNEWSIVKSSKSGATINPAADSQPITYGVVLTKTPTHTVTGKVTVTNPNPFAVTGVDVTDSIPGASCTVTGGAVGTLNAGASAEATYACTVGSSADGTNTASVAWTDPANVVHNQLGPANYTFATATLVHDAVNVTDVFDGGAATPQAGNVSAGGAISDYTKNAPMTGVTLDGNGCRNVVNTATLTATDDAGYTRDSSVTVTLCKPAGGTLGGPSAVAGTTGTPTSRAALRLSKTGPGAATAGQLVTYRIKVTNRSKIAARNVVLRDVLPSGFSVSGKVKGAGISKGRVTWKVGSLAAGKSKTVIVKFRIDRNVGGRRCNQAVATAGNATTVRDAQCTRIAAVVGALQPAVTG